MLLQPTTTHIAPEPPRQPRFFLDELEPGTLCRYYFDEERPRSLVGVIIRQPGGVKHFMPLTTPELISVERFHLWCRNATNADRRCYELTLPGEKIIIENRERPARKC